ncbi:glycosyltransferase [Erwinia sp. CPCC 100877]|nr:glycosyltransferase [Erwinia sp. CPCC 100877]
MDISNKAVHEIYSFGHSVENGSQRSLHIAYGVDRNFLFGAAISMQSVCLYNKNISLCFHLFTDYVDDDYKKRVKEFCHNNGVSVHIYMVSPDVVKLFPCVKQWSYATFFRFVAFDYLSKVCDRVLYIDADVICKGDLSELLDIQFDSDRFVAVVKDNTYMQGKPAARLKVEGLPGNYFNAGMIYLQLAEWKSNSFSEKAIGMLAGDPEHKKYKCLDQDILNILFFDHCVYLNDNFNKLYGIDYELKNLREDDYLKFITDETRLIHYVGVTKPWHIWADYPCRRFFSEAFQNSSWNDIDLFPASDEMQFKVRYQHDWKKRHFLSFMKYYIKYQREKLSKKYFPASQI